MTTNATTQTTATETTTPVATTPKEPKTATITLVSNGVTLTLRAHRLKSGAETFVTTTEGKTTTRGMTVVHKTFEAAKAAIEVDAAKAVKLGWVRREAGRGYVAAPDAFSSLPAAPKAAPSAPKVVKAKK